jgi:hypothetical protein
MSLVEDTTIAALDFASIKRTLMRGKSGKGWPRERVEAAEGEYRRFLYLMKKYPNELTAPPVEVDTFWHHHIVDTEKYARDCAAVFGYFLHHNPYLGIRGEDAAAVRLRAGKRMRELYEQTFGETSSGGESAFCGAPGISAAEQAAAFHATACFTANQPQAAAALLCADGSDRASLHLVN